MKKYLIFLIFLFHLTFLSNAFAQPMIESMKLNPENVICFHSSCDDVLISVNCSGNNTRVFGYISDPIQTNNFSFVHENNISKYILSGELFTAVQSSSYTLNIICQDSSGESSSVKNFFVSELEASIYSIDSPSYVGDDASSLKVLIKKDDSSIPTPWVNFTLKPTSLKYWYFLDPFYVILFNIPGTVGNYNLELGINVSIPTYKSKLIKLTTTLEVKEPIDFRVLSIDKTEVRPNDIITVSLSASEKGNNIILRKEYLSFQIGSISIASDKVTLYSAGDHFDAKILIPDLSPDYYELKITLNYANYSLTQTRNVGYILPISGKFVDLNNKGINVEIKFLVENVEKKRFVTDSSGSYSGSVIPGTYTIQLTLPQSTLYLYNARVSSFNDPIKYYFSDSDIEWIKIAGLFVYEVAVPFTNAKIVMNYDEKKVTNEKSIVVYKCSEFNPANKICNTNWEEQTATIDTVANSVTIETNSLSAYAVGTKKSLHLDFSSDKSVFSINELIRIRGVTRDESGNFVPNVLVNASIHAANIKSVYSDSNGVFTLEFFAPEEEGFYNLLLRAEKVPYLSSNKTWSFQVSKARSISLVVPDTIRIKLGENLTLQFSVVNTGQDDVSNLSISLAGLPKDYFYLPEKIDELRVGQEVKIPVNFKIPKDASETTLSLTLRVNSSEVSKEEIIGFTIFSENVTLPANQTALPIFSFPTAYFTLPVSLSDVAYALIFGAVIISVAYFLRKRKIGEVKERRDIKNLLSDIKNEIKRKKFMHPVQTFNQLVENVSKKDKEL